MPLNLTGYEYGGLFSYGNTEKSLVAFEKRGETYLAFFFGGGGSRSGKTTVLVLAIIYRALRFAGSRHLICRYRAKDARSSVLRETLLPWLEVVPGSKRYSYLAHESMITFYNGSEIWIGGLGDREQADKILGHEYNTIYFNEISPIVLRRGNDGLQPSCHEDRRVPEPFSL